MTVASETATRISDNLSSLEDALASFLKVVPLSRAWIEFSWPIASGSIARPLLVGARLALLEAGVSWGIGSNRGAAASLRTYLENSIAWLFYKDHPIEYKVMAARDEDLLLPKATKLYLQRVDKNFEKAYAFLNSTSKRPNDYFYSDVSQFVHAHPAFAEATTDLVKAAISVPRDDGFLTLCSNSDEFISDVYSTTYRNNWDQIPAEVQTNLKDRLAGKLSKFIEL